MLDTTSEVSTLACPLCCHQSSCNLYPPPLGCLGADTPRKQLRAALSLQVRCRRTRSGLDCMATRLQRLGPPCPPSAQARPAARDREDTGGRILSGMQTLPSRITRHCRTSMSDIAAWPGCWGVCCCCSPFPRGPRRQVSCAGSSARLSWAGGADRDAETGLPTSPHRGQAVPFIKVLYRNSRRLLSRSVGFSSNQCYFWSNKLHEREGVQ